MKKEYKEPTMEVIKISRITLLENTADTGHGGGGSTAPALDDFEDMLPAVVVGKE